MALGTLLRRLFGRGKTAATETGKNVGELASRLGMSADALRTMRVDYREFRIPKRAGGSRVVHAPDKELKVVQRRILRRLLARLHSHAAATGFERRCSIVHNARCHAGSALVIRLDIENFFKSTRDERVRKLFKALGWNREATELLTRLCTYRGGLPQGAPTSPRLSNLVNYGLDVRLAALATSCPGTIYTRYADDITFSVSTDDRRVVRRLVAATGVIAAEFGYRLHGKRKLRVRRRHQRQTVTGLVVNEKANLPRKVRRWLRAVEHHRRMGRSTSLTASQLDGWRAFATMVKEQSES